MTETHSRRPRVLVVMLRPQGSPARPTGGGQISAVQIAVALRELGVRVCMVEGEPSILVSYARILEEYTLGADRNFLGDTIGILKTVRRTKCDSIYAFSDFFPETIVPCFLAALITRKKLFVNVTSTAYEFEDGRRFLGLVRSRVRALIRSRMPRVPGIGPLLSFTFFHAARRFVFRTGSCLVKNHFMESYAKSRLHARRVFVVGAGVEEFWFERAGGERSFDCVYSGRFDPSKRVSTLVRAWQIVVKKKPDARLLLIGESASERAQSGGEEFPEVKRLVDDFGLSSNVVFVGFINDRRVLADRVSSAKVFVFPSVREGFGLAVAEAMAAGLPCVLSDVEPLREVFGEAALLARADDPSAFADAILGLILDGRKRLEYSARSKSLARTFSWNAVGKKVLAALSEE